MIAVESEENEDLIVIEELEPKVAPDDAEMIIP